jgi:hypothetical protein
MQMNDSNSDPIANILNITPIVKEDGVVIYQEETETYTEIDSDIAYARSMMYNTIKDAADAVDTMLDLAKQSQHPRAFEVVATKDLLDLHKVKKDLNKEDPTGPDTVNNNLFIGSTADLLNMLKNKE